MQKESDGQINSDSAVVPQNDTNHDGFEVKNKRVYILDQSLENTEDVSLISFEFNRQQNDGEKFKIFYS